MATVHFSIEGEFITDFCRNLWAEGAFQKSLDILDCVSGLSFEQQQDILRGTKKLTGVNEIDLVSDNWGPPKGWDYPSFAEVLERASKFPSLQDYQHDEGERLAIRAAELYVTDVSGEESEQIDFLLTRSRTLLGEHESADDLFDAEVERLKGEQGKFIAAANYDAPLGSGSSGLTTHEILAHHQRIQMELYGFDPSALPDPETVLHRGYNTKPKKASNMSSANGWLLPDGSYYACGGMEHVGVADQVLTEKGETFQDAEQAAEKRGWIKLSKSFTGFHCIGFKKPTKKQLNKLWDYAQHHGRDYEDLIRHLSDGI